MKNILIFCGRHGFLSSEESGFSDDGQVIVCIMCGAACFVKSADYLILRTKNETQRINLESADGALDFWKGMSIQQETKIKQLESDNERLNGDLQAAIDETDELTDVIYNLESDIASESW